MSHSHHSCGMAPKYGEMPWTDCSLYQEVTLVQWMDTGSPKARPSYLYAEYPCKTTLGPETPRRINWSLLQLHCCPTSPSAKLVPSFLYRHCSQEYIPVNNLNLNLFLNLFPGELDLRICSLWNETSTTYLFTLREANEITKMRLFSTVWNNYVQSSFTHLLH